MISYINTYRVECKNESVSVFSLNSLVFLDDKYARYLSGLSIILAAIPFPVYFCKTFTKKDFPWIHVILHNRDDFEIPFRSNLVMYKMAKCGLNKTKRKNVKQYVTKRRRELLYR